MVRILIADDHDIVRQGMRSLFSLRSNWEVCGEAIDGRDAVEKAKQLRPDVVLLDISMPLLNGLEAARVIRREVPQTQILIVSQHDAAHMRPKALEAGARGYVAKSDLSRELLTAVDALLGETKSNGAGASLPVAATRQAAIGSDVPRPGWECLAGGGEMGVLMRSTDWSKTRLGPVEKWPRSLKTSISICLNSTFPILIWWGPELVMLYNDGYRQLIGSKHPTALGNPGRECWYEIWTTIGPMLDGVLYRGQSTWADDMPLMLERHGYPEDCYFTFSYSPIRDDAGNIVGVFTPVNETTDQVIGERRLRTLHDLAARASDAESEEDAWRLAAKTLGENLFDIPFSIFCQVTKTRDTSKVLQAAGMDPQHPLCLALCKPDSPLFKQIRKVADSGNMLILENLADYAEDLPFGAWEVQPRSGVLLSLTPPGHIGPAGVLFLAVSPRKTLDPSYRTFLRQVARQVASNIADARSYDDERKRGEAQYRLAAIIESSDDAIVSKDLSGIIQSWNLGAQRIFGYTEAEVIGKSITLIIPPELRDQEKEILRRLRAGQRIDHFETVRMAKDGRRVDISLTTSPVRDATGKIIGASKIARDISERNQAQAALKKAHDELESRVKSRTAELEQAQSNLRALSTRLLQMQDEERRRIARDLHDTSGQVIAALNMNLVPLEPELKVLNPGLARLVTDSIALLDDLSSGLRTISHLLHPPLLDEAGLTSAIQWYVEGFAERSKIPVHLEIDPDLGRLSADLETTVFRIVQECLTNIHRHSGSATAGIVLRRENHGLRLEIRDAGKGIVVPPSGSVRPGVGIQGMRERVRQLGGTFDLRSGSTGTIISAYLPEADISA